MTSGRLLIGGFIALLLSCVLMARYSSGLNREKADLQARQKEMSRLKEEFGALKSAVDSVEGKKSLTKVDGVVQAVDEVFRSIGLNQKVKSVKPLGVREQKYAIEEEAEVQVEKADLNEVVNIFYKIENSPMVLSVRKTTMKTSFDNPSLLNVTLTVGLIKPK